MNDRSYAIVLRVFPGPSTYLCIRAPGVFHCIDWVTGLSHPLDCDPSPPKAGDLVHLLYLSCVAWGLAHSKRSVNVFWMNEWTNSKWTASCGASCWVSCIIRLLFLTSFWPFYLSKVPANHANSIYAAHEDVARVFLNVFLSLRLVTHKDIIRCLTQRADTRD